MGMNIENKIVKTESPDLPNGYLIIDTERFNGGRRVWSAFDDKDLIKTVNQIFNDGNGPKDNNGEDLKTVDSCLNWYACNLQEIDVIRFTDVDRKFIESKVESENKHLKHAILWHLYLLGWVDEIETE